MRQRRAVEGARERQCGDKYRHETRAQAREHRRAMRQKTGKRYNIYACPFCGYYHVGTRDPQVMRSIQVEAERKQWVEVEQRVTMEEFRGLTQGGGRRRPAPRSAVCGDSGLPRGDEDVHRS